MAGIRFRDVEVHRADIVSQFSSIGQAGKWIHALSYEMKLLAAVKAPKRSMELSRSHYISFRRGTNGISAISTVENRADHASFVHDGTTRQVGWRTLPPGGPNAPTKSRYAPGTRFEAKTVRNPRGQVANPWLNDACAQVARSVGAIEYL